MPYDQVDIDDYDIDDNGELKPKAEKEMSFMDHLEELRWHILRSVAAILVLAIGVFLSKDFVFNTVIFGPRHKDFWTYKMLCRLSEATCFEPKDFKLIAPSISEKFTMHMMISFWLGLVIASPYIVWEIWRFIKPGLYEKERKAASGFVLVCSSLFLLGIAFGYYIVSPLAMSFLVGYELEGVDEVFSLGSYVDSLVMFTLPIGLVFELPIVAFFLGKIGLITAEMMKSYRRYAVVILLVLAAIITPSPDVTSQMLVFFPLYMLYEVSIFVVARVEKKQLKAEELESKGQIKKISGK